MVERLDWTHLVEVYANIYDAEERARFPEEYKEESEFDCTVGITLPSDVWVSPQGARKIAADLIKAANEVEAELRRRGNKNGPIEVEKPYAGKPTWFAIPLPDKL